MILTVVVFFIILSVLVLVHEFGHFITAKSSGIVVEEFGLGYPPRIFGFKRGTTIYSLNAIPFGGFTKLLGEEDPTAPGSFASKSYGTRFLVLIAGSLMNILFPILLFAISFMVPHNEISEKVQITAISAESPAQMAGLEAGDIILAINDRQITNRGQVGYNVQLNLGSPTKLLILKPDNTEKEVIVIPRWKPPEGQGAIGIMIDGVDTGTVVKSMPFWEAIPQGAIHCWEILVLYRNEIMGWFIKGTTPQLTGPIGIAQLTGEVVKSGITTILEFTAFISISLGIFNLFPFPGLDGGRIVFVFLELIRGGRRISPKHEGLIHTIGFFMLIALILVISYFDIIRIIQGNSLIP